VDVDPALVRAVQRGEKGAMDDLIRASYADVYALCRREGATVRKLTDCLIAVVAIREDAELVHCDADFTAIAARTTLRCRSS
jgi:predicted nucleic acid-binding protein